MRLKNTIHSLVSPKYRRKRKELNAVLDFAENLIEINNSNECDFGGKKDNSAIFSYIKHICDVINTNNTFRIIKEKCENKTYILEDDILFGDTPNKSDIISPFKVYLGKDSVISSAKDFGKMEYVFKHIGGNGVPWQEDKINHSYRLIMPLGITFVEEGNHSIETGIIKCVGSLSFDKSKYNCSVFDISPLYQQIYFDGIYYRTIRNNEIVEKTEFEYGCLFEIGRLLSLQTDIQFKEKIISSSK